MQRNFKERKVTVAEAGRGVWRGAAGEAGEAGQGQVLQLWSAAVRVLLISEATGLVSFHLDAPMSSAFSPLCLSVLALYLSGSLSSSASWRQGGAEGQWRWAGNPLRAGSADHSQ